MWNEALITWGKRSQDIQWSNENENTEHREREEKDKHRVWIVLCQRDNNSQGKRDAVFSNNLQA